VVTNYKSCDTTDGINITSKQRSVTWQPCQFRNRKQSRKRGIWSLSL